MDKEITSFNISKESIVKLKKLAEKYGKNKSQTIEQLIMESMDKTQAEKLVDEVMSKLNETTKKLEEHIQMNK